MVGARPCVGPYFYLRGLEWGRQTSSACFPSLKVQSDSLWRGAAEPHTRAPQHIQTSMVLPSVAEKKFTEGHPKLKICVTGAGGFIASHLSKRLKEEGHFVRAVDWKENEHRRTS